MPITDYDAVEDDPQPEFRLCGREWQLPPRSRMPARRVARVERFRMLAAQGQAYGLLGGHDAELKRITGELAKLMPEQSPDGMLRILLGDEQVEEFHEAGISGRALNLLTRDCVRFYVWELPWGEAPPGVEDDDEDGAADPPAEAPDGASQSPTSSSSSGSSSPTSDASTASISSLPGTARATG